jgi:superfamily II DNA or RNA helicase
VNERQDTFALAERVKGKRVALPGYFSAPVVVEAADPEGDATVFLRVRTSAGLLEEVPVSVEALQEALGGANILADRSVEAADQFLLVEAARIRLAYAHDPYFAVSLSGVEALPHQLEAVYERMLPQGRLRFLLAHDPGAGKTIMAGLLMKELKLRGALDRVLVVCPAPLTLQWQDEMRSRFEETFEIVNAELGRNTLAGNPWQRFSQIITSLDFVKQPAVAEAALRVPWDLVIIDEAHKCSAQRFGAEVKKTLRYAFAEAVSRQTDRLLLMTATPHQGNADQFELFLRLLDEDQFVGLDLDREMIALDESPWFSRRIKEELRDFDGRPLFTRRTVLTQPFELRRTELDLYEAVTDYINTFLPRQSGRRRTSVALARSVLQRRLASSLGAIEATLVKRHRRFTDLLEELARLPSVAREKRMREMRLLEVDPEIDSDDTDAEDEDRIAEQATVVERLEDLRLEVSRLAELIAQTRTVRGAGEEAKLTALKQCLERSELRELEDGRGKLLIFTEYRATQDYLADQLKALGFSITTIHGGMDAQRRKNAQIEFQTDRQICIATEAAGEGINLQFCHLMINYDIPWNPNRLEQRMGRIHRIGQKFDVTVFNFVAQNTVEGRILLRLLAKLDEIRRAMGSDRVFDVIGTLLKLNGVNLEEMLREAAYSPTSVEAYEAQIEAISEARLHEYEEATGIALATRQVNLERVRPKDWRSDERRLMPEYVERFFVEAAERVRLRLELRADGLWRVEHVPQRLRAPSLAAVQRYGPPADGYRKLTFRKENLNEDRHLDAELLSPGHALFASVIDVLDQQLAQVRQGSARFIDPFSRQQYRLFAFETQILGELPPGSGRPARSVTAYAELTLVRENEDGTFVLAAPDALHDLTPASGVLSRAAGPDEVRRAERWLQVNHATAVAAQLRETRRQETSIRREYLERSFHELIKQRRNSWAAFASRVASGEDSFKLARDEAQRNLEETERRRQQKIDDLSHLEALRPGPVTYLGCAVVDPVSDIGVARLAQADAGVEHAAVNVAMAYEREMGWEPEYVGDLRDGSGFDIRSTGPSLEGARPVRRIEVKGRASADATVLITPNEWTQAGRHGSGYWLYVVTEAMTETPTLLRIQDPHHRLEGSAETLTVVRGYALPSAAIKRLAEVGT